MKRKWPQAQIDDFINWHEKRMEELGYPIEVRKELRDARTKWLPLAE